MTCFLLPLLFGSGSVHAAARLVLLLSVVFLGFSVSVGKAQEAGGGLAQPGELKMKLSVLDMGGVESWADPGTWGALLITKEQADELNRRWDETLAAFPGASDDQAALDSEQQAWQSAVKEFQSVMREILAPDQMVLRHEIKKMAHTLWKEIRQEDHQDGFNQKMQDFRPLLQEQLEALLTPEQLENYRLTSGMSPTGASSWRQ